MNATPPNERTRRLARRALAAAAFVVLGAVTLPSLAAVYKWIDPKGEIHYSDRPPPPEGKLLSIDTNAQRGHERGSEPAPRASAPGPSAAPGAPNAPLSAEAAAKLKQSVDSDVSNARADQCKQAQDKYQNYIHSRRLFKEGPNKERIYLSDQELETERLNAKHEVDELCGTGSG